MVECGDESDCGNVDCGDKGRDGCAEETRVTAIPHPTQPLPLTPIPNLSKPIA